MLTNSIDATQMRVTRAIQVAITKECKIGHICAVQSLIVRERGVVLELPCDQRTPNLININKLNPRPSSLDQHSPGFRPFLTSIEHVYLHTCQVVGSVGYNSLIRGGIRI